jgi:hypothetical protein
MFEKVLIFGVGYLLGAKAGKARYEELMETLKGLAGRDEVKMAASLAMSLLEDRVAAFKMAA